MNGLCLDADLFAQDIAKMLPLEVDEKALSTEWAERFESILRPFGPWEYNHNWGKNKKGELYFKMCDNFMRYMHESTGISWMSAHYHVFLLYEYAMTCLQGNKNIKGKKMFDFSENTIEKVAHQVTMNHIFFPDPTKLFSLLNVIHYFAGYLERCGMKEEINRDQIEETTASLYQNVYSSLKNTFSETRCFPEFPFWGEINSESI